MLKDDSYTANYNYAMSYLKLGQREAALEALKRALSQVPEDEKNKDNATYLSILSVIAFIVIEDKDYAGVARYVEEGLSIKHNHADLLFMKALLLLDEKRFDEMLEALIHYLLSLDETDSDRFNYRYAHEGALKEVYDNLLPMACKYAFEYSKITDITRQLCKATGSERLKKACDAMEKVSSVRSHKEN